MGIAIVAVVVVRSACRCRRGGWETLVPIAYGSDEKVSWCVWRTQLVSPSRAKAQIYEPAQLSELEPE
ncbi:hypothetical protein V6N11_018331 [Hibiscus sabdariffa]|uniref:Secreted protein n=1 Tax=Hibiscus sabdariffa TaxID=183260 RepID=A0ABR2T741_9ROSI